MHIVLDLARETVDITSTSCQAIELAGSRPKEGERRMIPIVRQDSRWLLDVRPPLLEACTHFEIGQ